MNKIRNNTRRGCSRLRTRILQCMVLLAALTACAGTETKQEPRQPAPISSAAAKQTEHASESPQSESRVSAKPTIVQGTAQFTRSPAPQPATARVSTEDGYQVSFVDTEIATVVASILGDGLGVAYTIDPKIKGTMTLEATRPLSRDEVLFSLEGALRAYGAALVESNGAFSIVPSLDAARRVSRLLAPGERGRPGFGIQIAPLKYISATEMEKVLRPFAPENGILRVDEGRNLLLLAGTAQELATMAEVIATFDVNWLEGMSFALFPLEYVDAKTAADELGGIFADPKSPMADLVRFVPLDRLNSLMVVTFQPSLLKEIESWVKRLDLGVATPGRRIYIYDVQNGKADELADSLSRILSLDDAGGGRDAEPRRAARFSTADSVSSGRNEQSVERRANQERSAERSEEQSSNGTGRGDGGVRIEPNEESNALMILATPGEFAVIENALKRLDVTPIQVMIEASLAEVTLNNALRFGVQWSYQSSDGPLVLSDSGSGTINQQFPGFSYLFTGSQDIRAVLNALESITDVDVLSSPKLLVLNNREAELQIGDQVPIAVQSAVSTNDPDAPIVNAVQLRDTGVILRVTPRVNKNGTVMLDIAQEVSDVVPTTTSGIDSPTIQQRKMASSVMVMDGETIALGGLIRENRSRTRSGVPLLRHIPLIGDLLGSTNNSKRRTELIVLITPRVIRSGNEAAQLMDDLRKEFRGLRKVIPEWRTKAGAGKEGEAGGDGKNGAEDLEPREKQEHGQEIQQKSEETTHQPEPQPQIPKEAMPDHRTTAPSEELPVAVP